MSGASGSVDRPGLRTLWSRPQPLPEGRKKASTLLNDGGVRDNMGLDPVFATHQYVIVSDGGSAFRFSGQRIFRPWLGRTLAVVQHQASAVRKSWLLSELQRDKPALKGTYWGIATGENVEEPQPPWLGDAAYSRRLAEQQLSRIRTDLNAFSEAEREILENHGYMLANALINKHKKNLGDLIEQKQVWPPLSVPNNSWFGDNAEDRMRAEDRIRTALRSSHRRVSIRRFISGAFERPMEGEA
jgi:NTE family protein